MPAYDLRIKYLLIVLRSKLKTNNLWSAEEETDKSDDNNVKRKLITYYIY